MTKRTSGTIIFLAVTVLFFGFLFFADAAKAATCAGFCSAAEEQVSDINCVACATDQVCCERKTQYAQCDPVNNVPTDGKACTINGQSGTCQNGVCAANSTGDVGGSKGNGESCNLMSECQSGCCYQSASASSATCQQASNCSSTGGPGGPGGPPSGTTGGGWSLGSVSGFGLPSGSILGIISGILTWLLGALGLLGVIGFVISGIMYLTSAGDEDQIDRAKRAMTWSIVGVVVGLIGVVIIQAIDYALRGFSMF